MALALEREDWPLPNLGSADGYPPPATLTATSIPGWMTCARCWAHDNIEHLTKGANLHFAVGTTVHHAAQCIAERLIAGKDEAPPVGEILEEALDVFDRESIRQSGRNGTEMVPATDEERADAKAIAERTARFLIPEILRVYRERRVVAVEYQLPASLNPFPFNMTGKADAISGGEKLGLPLVLSDIKTASDRRRPDQNNRIQGGIYALFVGRSGERPQVLFDSVTKAKTPQLNTYGLGPEGAAYMTDGQLKVVFDEVMLVAEAISEGYQAYLDGNWRLYYRCFPIGQGWNGKHDYDHGFPEAHQRLVVSFPGMEVTA